MITWIHFLANDSQFLLWSFGDGIIGLAQVGEKAVNMCLHYLFQPLDATCERQ
jgi:hypothetical protein